MPLALIPVAVAVAAGALVFRSEVAPSQAHSSASTGPPQSAVVLQHRQDTSGSTSSGANGSGGSSSVQGSTSSAASGTSTVKIGSILKVRKIA